MSNVPEWAVKAAEELTAEMDWTQDTKDYVKNRWAEIIIKHAPESMNESRMEFDRNINELVEAAWEASASMLIAKNSSFDCLPRLIIALEPFI